MDVLSLTGGVHSGRCLLGSFVGFRFHFLQSTKNLIEIFTIFNKTVRQSYCKNCERVVTKH